VLSGETTNTNFIVFGLTRPGLKHTIYRTRDEHANHYFTDAICSALKIVKARSVVKLALQDSYCGLLMHIKTGVERFL
jgi:hypothetical protein